MSFLLIFSSVFLNCLAQVFMRKGMLIVGKLSLSCVLESLPVLIINVWLWLAFVCYGVSVILWMVVLSKVEVSLAYPLSSVGYVITLVIGYLFMNESLDIYKIFGIAVIMFGVALVSKSGF